MPLLQIHQSQVRIIYKPGPELFITDWLSKYNHMENKDGKIISRGIRADTLQMSMSPRMHVSCTNKQKATVQDEHFQLCKGTSSQDGQKLKTRYNRT